MIEEDRNRMLESRRMLFKAISINEGSYESKITLIGSGAVALSMTYIATLDEPVCKLLFYVAISIIISALTLNLLLYPITVKWFKDEIDIIDDFVRDDMYRETNETIYKINQRVVTWNWRNLIVMILGIIIMICFVCVNVNSKVMKTEEKKTTMVVIKQDLDYMKNSFTSEYSAPQVSTDKAEQSTSDEEK